jgi:hypothetical protein
MAVGPTREGNTNAVRLGFSPPENARVAEQSQGDSNRSCDFAQNVAIRRFSVVYAVFAARLGVQEVAGSNPVGPTNQKLG